jgi:hypothetical protein
VLEGFFVGPAIEACAEALRAVKPATVAVVGQPRLARGLAEEGLAVIAIEPAAKSLRKLKAERLVGRGDALPVGDRALGALVGWGAGARADWADLLAEWSRAVADGGMIVMVDRGPSTELSRRALCSGLCELQQRAAGRLVVTSGIVTDL